MGDIIDGLIKKHHVNDVTEECTNNAHTIQNAISVDRFNKNDDDNEEMLGYIYIFLKSCFRNYFQNQMTSD